MLIVDSRDINALSSRIGRLGTRESHLDVLLISLADVSSMLPDNIHEVVEMNLALVFRISLLFKSGDEVIPLATTAKCFAYRSEGIKALAYMLLLMHRAEVLTVLDWLDALWVLAAFNSNCSLFILSEV